MPKSPCESLAAALKHACDAHGVPNGISPGELCDGHQTLTPIVVGRLVRRNRAELNRLLGASGYAITNYENQGPGYGWRIGLDSVAKNA
jgi:hypothetical protein